MLDKSPAHVGRVAVKAKRNRGRVVNRPQLQVLNMRTKDGRRLRDLADGYADALGGWAVLDELQAQAVRGAAEMTFLAETIRRRALEGDKTVSIDDVIRATRTAALFVKRLGIKPRKDDDGPDLAAFLLAREAAE